MPGDCHSSGSGGCHGGAEDGRGVFWVGAGEVFLVVGLAVGVGRLADEGAEEALGPFGEGLADDEVEALDEALGGGSVAEAPGAGGQDRGATIHDGAAGVRGAAAGSERMSAGSPGARSKTTDVGRFT